MAERLPVWGTNLPQQDRDGASRTGTWTPGGHWVPRIWVSLTKGGGVVIDPITVTSEVVATGTDALTTTVKTCMREPLVTIETSETILEAVRLMKEQGTRHLAVTDSGRIVGVVSVSDVLRYYSGVV